MRLVLKCCLNYWTQRYTEDTWHIAFMCRHFAHCQAHDPVNSSHCLEKKICTNDSVDEVFIDGDHVVGYGLERVLRVLNARAYEQVLDQRAQEEAHRLELVRHQRRVAGEWLHHVRGVEMACLRIERASETAIG